MAFESSTLQAGVTKVKSSSATGGSASLAASDNTTVLTAQTVNHTVDSANSIIAIEAHARYNNVAQTGAFSRGANFRLNIDGVNIAAVEQTVRSATYQTNGQQLEHTALFYVTSLGVGAHTIQIRVQNIENATDCAWAFAEVSLYVREFVMP